MPHLPSLLCHRGHNSNWGRFAGHQLHCDITLDVCALPHALYGKKHVHAEWELEDFRMSGMRSESESPPLEVHRRNPTRDEVPASSLWLPAGGLSNTIRLAASLKLLSFTLRLCCKQTKPQQLRDLNHFDPCTQIAPLWGLPYAGALRHTHTHG